MDRDELLNRYRETRGLSVELCRPLHPEDYRIQSMPDVSPPWWNLGHTTWFFAKNILEPFGLYSQEDARLEFVMNSYYESANGDANTQFSSLCTAIKAAGISIFTIGYGVANSGDNARRTSCAGVGAGITDDDGIVYTYTTSTVDDMLEAFQSIANSAVVGASDPKLRIVE